MCDSIEMIVSIVNVIEDMICSHPKNGNWTSKTVNEVSISIGICKSLEEHTEAFHTICKIAHGLRASRSRYFELQFGANLC